MAWFLSIVIPAYNEEKRIERSLDDVLRFLEGQTYRAEVIVVDDGSIDETAAIVSRFHVKALRLLRNHQNHGKGYTVRQGVLAATGTYVLFTDADLSAPIEELDKLWCAAGKGASVAIGSLVLEPIERGNVTVHDGQPTSPGAAPLPELGAGIWRVELPDGTVMTVEVP